MTISEARKIWGKIGDGISDIDVQKEIEIASLLKDVFFRLYFEENKTVKGHEKLKVVQ